MTGSDPEPVREEWKCHRNVMARVGEKSEGLDGDICVDTHFSRTSFGSSLSYRQSYKSRRSVTCGRRL